MTKSVIAMLHVRAISSVTPSTSYLITVLSVLQKARKKSPTLHVLLPSTRDLHVGQLPVDWLSVHYPLCTGSVSEQTVPGHSWDIWQEEWGCRDVGTRQQRDRISTSRQGSFFIPSTPGLLIKCTVILKQNYFKNIKVSRSKQDLGK